MDMNKEFQWRLLYEDGVVQEFLGTTHDMTKAVARRWLIDKKQPVKTMYRDDLEKPFLEFEVLGYEGE